VLCVVRWGKIQWAFVSLNNPLAIMRKYAGESSPRNVTGALLKEQNHNFVDDATIASGFPYSYS